MATNQYPTARFVHAPDNPHAPHDTSTLLRIIDEVARSRDSG